MVIFTSKLLTGFDAPILQAMYLDKPMRDHTLLQAICRTNRLFGDEKTHGLIVDYIGIFDDVARALQFDDKSVQQTISNLNIIKDRLPVLMKKCLDHFPEVDRTIEGYEGLMMAQESIKTNDLKDKFAADYLVLSRAWEALSPDMALNVYKKDYIWLSRVYESVRPVSNNGVLLWMALGAKTIDLVHKNIQVQEVRTDEEILELDSEMIEQYITGKKNAKRKRMKL